MKYSQYGTHLILNFLSQKFSTYCTPQPPYLCLTSLLSHSTVFQGITLYNILGLLNIKGMSKIRLHATSLLMAADLVIWILEIYEHFSNEDTPAPTSMAMLNFGEPPLQCGFVVLLAQ